MAPRECGAAITTTERAPGSILRISSLLPARSPALAAPHNGAPQLLAISTSSDRETIATPPWERWSTLFYLFSIPPYRGDTLCEGADPGGRPFLDQAPWLAGGFPPSYASRPFPPPRRGASTRGVAPQRGARRAGTRGGAGSDRQHDPAPRRRGARGRGDLGGPADRFQEG